MKAYLFDIDGVLTNPNDSENIAPIIFEKLLLLLEQDIPLGFITGRGLPWLQKNFIDKMEYYVNEDPFLDRKILDILYVSGEFGGVVAEHLNGIRLELLKKDHKIPEELKKTIIKIVNKYDEHIFIENGKQTILTIRTNMRINDSISLQYKNELIATLTVILQKYPHIEAQSDRLSINIRLKNANKKFATDYYIQWLTKKGFNPDHYYVFGDSPSDLEMGEELLFKNLPFTFIFLGRKQDLIRKSYPFPITVTKKHSDKGLLEYLNSLGSY